MKFKERYLAWDRERQELAEVLSVQFRPRKATVRYQSSGQDFSVPLEDLKVLEYSGYDDVNSDSIFEGDLVKVTLRTGVGSKPITFIGEVTKWQSMWVLEGGADRISLGGSNKLNLLRLGSSYEDQGHNSLCALRM